MYQPHQEKRYVYFGYVVKIYESFHIPEQLILQRKNPVHPSGEFGRSKRICSKPNRLGKRESTVNHNEFFEKFRKQKSQNSPDQAHDTDTNCELYKTTTCYSQNKQTAPKGVILIDDSSSCVSALETSTQPKCCSHDAEFKALVIASMTSIKEHLIRLDSKISHQRNINDSSNEVSGIVDVNKLKNFGVPVDSEEKLLALDKNLKDEQYRANLVRTRF